MKTAEEWYKESDTHWGEGRCSMTQSTIKAIQAKALMDAAEVISKKQSAIYVGSNPIREGIKRGMSDAAIEVYNLVEKL